MGGRARASLIVTLVVSGCAGGAAPADQPLSGGAPLVVTDMDGARHDLDAALERGGTVGLVFWQTWCESCAQEAPRLAEAAREHQGRIAFLGVVPGRDDLVDAGEVRAVARRWGYGFPQVRDPDLVLSRRLGVEGTPTIVVLGRGREVLYRGHRPPPEWAPYLGAPAAPAPGADGCADGVCPLPGE